MRKDKTEEAPQMEETAAPNGSVEHHELDWKRVYEELGKPFEAGHIRVKPGKVGSSGQALALWYIDARAVMDRLDEVVGPENWQFSWSPIPTPDGHVVIQGVLSVLGITKSDVGEAKGEDEPWKSGVSDAFKRTAVQFGIGRFLYRLPQVWWPYDEQSKRFAQQDELAEFVAKVMEDLGAADGDTRRIDLRDYSNMIPRDSNRSRQSGRASGSTETSEAPGAISRGEITPAQEGYIRRLYNQKFGRFTNGNQLFANFLKESIGRVVTIEKLTRAEADIVIKGLQDLASAA